ILWAIAQSSRLFTRMDSLLKQCNAAPRKLGRYYQSYKHRYTQAAESSILLRTQKIAGEVSSIESSKRLEIEHLLLALCQSDDPLVKDVLQQAGLTSQALLQAIPRVQEKSPIRFTL